MRIVLANNKEKQRAWDPQRCCLREGQDNRVNT